VPNHHVIKAYKGSGNKASRILNFGTRWRCVVNFTLRPLYLREMSPSIPSGEEARPKTWWRWDCSYPVSWIVRMMEMVMINICLPVC